MRVLEPSDMYDSTHAAVEIRYEEGRGRFAVASRDIEMGTPLFREKAQTYTLHPEKFGTNCQHCFKPIRGVIPCQGNFESQAFFTFLFDQKRDFSISSFSTCQKEIACQPIFSKYQTKLIPLG